MILNIFRVRDSLRWVPKGAGVQGYRGYVGKLTTPVFSMDWVQGGFLQLSCELPGYRGEYWSGNDAELKRVARDVFSEWLIKVNGR